MSESNVDLIAIYSGTTTCGLYVGLKNGEVYYTGQSPKSIGEILEEYDNQTYWSWYGVDELLRTWDEFKHFFYGPHREPDYIKEGYLIR